MPSVKNLEKNRFVKRGKYWLKRAKENVYNWAERRANKKYDEKYKYPSWTIEGRRERNRK